MWPEHLAVRATFSQEDQKVSDQAVDYLLQRFVKKGRQLSKTEVQDMIDTLDVVWSSKDCNLRVLTKRKLFRGAFNLLDVFEPTEQERLVSMCETMNLIRPPATPRTPTEEEGTRNPSTPSAPSIPLLRRAASTREECRTASTASDAASAARPRPASQSSTNIKALLEARGVRIDPSKALPFKAPSLSALPSHNTDSPQAATTPVEESTTSTNQAHPTVVATVDHPVSKSENNFKDNEQPSAAPRQEKAYVPRGVAPLCDLHPLLQSDFVKYAPIVTDYLYRTKADVVAKQTEWFLPILHIGYKRAGEFPHRSKKLLDVAQAKMKGLSQHHQNYVLAWREEVHRRWAAFVKEELEKQRSGDEKHENVEENMRRVQEEQQQRLQNEMVRRTKIAKEILDTEESYVKSLQILVKEYLTPMRTEKLLSEKKLKLIFGCTEVLLPYNQSLLAELRERMREWDPAATRIGDVFISIGPFLKIYGEYAAGYKDAGDTLKHCLDKFKYNRVKNWLADREKSSACQRLSVMSYLIMPVQRIPRYNLLLQDLYRHTADNHPDKKPLEEAVEKIQQVATYINESINKTFMIKKIDQIQGLSSLLEAHRYFVREGTYTLQWGGDKSDKFQEYELLLLSDMVVMVKKKVVETSFQLCITWVKRSERGFSLIDPVRHCYVGVPIRDDRDNWCKDLTRQIKLSLVEESSEEAVFVGAGMEKPRNTRYYYTDGSNYEGEWVHGKRHGLGRMTFTDGRVYDGRWENNEIEGMGMMTFANGDQYKGHFSCGNIRGKGTMFFVNGDVMEGEWTGSEKDGILSGTGDLRTEDGIQFHGNFQSGKFVGKGTLIDKLGTYTGDFADGSRTGQGIQKYSSGDKYIGGWLSDKRHGKGEFYATDGKRYEGQWMNGRKHGKGTLFFSTGDFIVGTWREGHIAGQVDLIFNPRITSTWNNADY